jgi:spore coat polysaccharide biosynthesis protein SpsF
MRKIAIVQARMGSTRLPGKVMQHIAGKPMLWHVVNRIKYSKVIDEIVIATTKNEEDDRIENFCKDNSLLYYRGDENDVLDRYYHAAREYSADVIIRITSDCPLIDPKIIDYVIKEHLSSNANYTSNTIKRTYPRGLDTEAFSFKALYKAWREAKVQYQREHVTPYMYENEQLFTLNNVQEKRDLSGLRWTVDEQEDLNFVRVVYEKLYQNKKIFLMRDILALLERHAHLSCINHNIKQKDIK